MEEFAKKAVNTEAIEQKSTILNVSVSWCGLAWNSTPLQAAQQVVADLFDLLARGGKVSVRVTGMDGEEYTVEVGARR